MDYLNYKIEDFISDESFQRYCLGKDEADVLFWKKWKEEHPQKHYEIEEAEFFIHSMNTRETGRKNLDYTLRKNAIRQNIQQKVSRSGKRKSSHRTMWFLVAASLTLFLCALIAIVSSQNDSPTEKVVTYNEVVNPPGVRSSMRLTDGTVVHLNSESRFKYPVSFSESNVRQVELEGEAFFEVKRDETKPFIVLSKNLKTTVLGTSFNVHAYHNQPMSVALVTGKVLVTKTGAEEQQVSLEPGEGATILSDNAGIETFKFDNKKMISWKDWIFYFNNASQKEVFAQLESWYGVKINITKPIRKKWGYTGEFKNKSLKEVLLSIGFAMDFDFEIKGDSVLINQHVIQ
jgi:ferric-dicitrate binding protein FerR (iron transport regulator)